MSTMYEVRDNYHSNCLNHCIDWVDSANSNTLDDWMQWYTDIVSINSSTLQDLLINQYYRPNCLRHWELLPNFLMSSAVLFVLPTLLCRWVYPSSHKSDFFFSHWCCSYVSPLLHLDACYRWQLPTSGNQAEYSKCHRRLGGQNIDSLLLYLNYCLADMPLENMYGRHTSLQMIKDRYDPSNVMRHAGGLG